MGVYNLHESHVRAVILLDTSNEVVKITSWKKGLSGYFGEHHIKIANATKQ